MSNNFFFLPKNNYKKTIIIYAFTCSKMLFLNYIYLLLWYFCEVTQNCFFDNLCLILEWHCVHLFMQIFGEYFVGFVYFFDNFLFANYSLQKQKKNWNVILFVVVIVKYFCVLWMNFYFNGMCLWHGIETESWSVFVWYLYYFKEQSRHLLVISCRTCTIFSLQYLNIYYNIVLT